MRKEFFVRLFRRAVAFAVLALFVLLLGLPSAIARAAPRGDGEPPAAAGGIDLSGFAPFVEEAAQLLAPAAFGIPIGLAVLVFTAGAAFVGLAKTGMQKRYWAVGTGIAFGLLANLQALAAAPAPPGTLQLLTALLGGIVRGLTAGIIAALVYETYQALIDPARKATA